MNEFDWKKVFFNIDVDKMDFIFDKNIINTLVNFTPHETVLFDDRDLPWMKKEIKKLIIWKEKHF